MKDMLLSKSCLLGALGGALLSVSLQLVFHFSTTTKRDGLGTAVDWRSFSPHERDIYAEGYANGYNVGAQAVCDMTDRLFEIERRGVFEERYI